MPSGEHGQTFVQIAIQSDASHNFPLLLAEFLNITLKQTTTASVTFDLRPRFREYVVL